MNIVVVNNYKNIKNYVFMYILYKKAIHGINNAVSY